MPQQQAYTGFGIRSQKTNATSCAISDCFTSQIAHYVAKITVNVSEARTYSQHFRLSHEQAMIASAMVNTRLPMVAISLNIRLQRKTDRMYINLANS